MRLIEMLDRSGDYRIVCRMNARIESIDAEVRPGNNHVVIKVNGEDIVEFPEPSEERRALLKGFFESLDVVKTFGMEKGNVCDRILDLEMPGY